MHSVKNEYAVGCSTIDVTPPVGIFLSGYGGRYDPSDGVYHPLRAVSTVIDDGEAPLLLVSIEWLGFYERTEEARRRIAAATGIAPERMVLSGTHTHCGPVLRQGVDVRRHGKIDEDYIDRTLEALAQSAREALDRRAPARLRSGTDWCGFAASRRRPDGPNKVAYKPSRDAPHDHEVSVLAIETPAGDLRQLLFSYACHPISAGPITRIGGDFVAYACDYLEATYPGVSASFFQACAGDQKVDVRGADNDGWRNLELDEVDTLGQQLGQAVRRVIDVDNLRPISGSITTSQTMLPLRTEPADPNELEECARSTNDYVREWAEHHLELARRGEQPVQEHNFEIQTICFGQSLLIITLACEPNVEYGLSFKREWASRYGDVFVFGYTNDMVGYLPVRRQIPEGGYEVIDNHRYQLYTGPFTAETEESIQTAVRQVLTTD
jgi:neutral ceramidase